MAATVTVSGTPSVVANKPANQGGTVVRTYGAGDGVLATSLQPASLGSNLDLAQEVNLFIGGVAAALTIAPMAAARLIEEIISRLRVQYRN